MRSERSTVRTWDRRASLAAAAASSWRAARMRARLLEAERQKQREADSVARRSMIGAGDRADKIRTYNFPQDRVTDHRVGMDLSNLPRVLGGDLDKLIDTLITTDQAERLSALVDSGAAG